MVEEEATTAKVMVRATKEVAQVIMQYKVSVEFEDKVSEAVYNAFYKGFNKCK